MFVFFQGSETRTADGYREVACWPLSDYDRDELPSTAVVFDTVDGDEETQIDYRDGVLWVTYRSARFYRSRPVDDERVAQIREDLAALYE